MPPYTLPPIGFGTYDVFDVEEVLSAIETGYRHLDTGQWYENEDVVGRAIEACDVPREELTVATKVLPSNLAGEDVLASTGESLERLGVETIDLLYVHWPTNAYDPVDTLAAFDRLVEAGDVRYVGVSNFTEAHVEEALAACESTVLANQVEMHPLFQQTALREYVQDLDMYLVAYAPLAQGRVFGVPELVEVAERHDANEAQVSLAWLMEKDVVPIPKATGDHVRDNYAALELDLDEADVELIDGIDVETRYVRAEDQDRVEGNPWA
jgi:2,5-diketo-D-gluconate reductase B